MTNDKKTPPGLLFLALGGLPILLTVGILLLFYKPPVYRCPMYVEGSQMSQVDVSGSNGEQTASNSMESGDESSSAVALGVQTPVSIQLGADIFEQSCVSCHGPDGKGVLATETKAPITPVSLGSWGVQGRKNKDLLQAISNHEYVTPLFSSKFSTRERWGLVHYMRSAFSLKGKTPWASLKGQSAEKIGSVVFDALDCNRCHGDDRPRELAGFPPTLDHVGSKLKRDWIVSYLLKPYQIRWESAGVRPLLRMPSFKLERWAAEALADYLSSQVDTVRFPEGALAGQGDAKEGKSLFKSYQCQGCHSLKGKGNEIGPDLTKAGLRLKPAYIFQWVKDPQGVIPGTAMKDYELWDDEASSLVRYVETLK